MLIYSGPPDVVARMKTLYRSGIPRDVASVARVGEDAEAIGEIMSLAEQQISGWVRQSQIHTASGLWLDLHGKDESVHRQAGESDAAYQARLIIPITAGTVTAILDALEQLLDTQDVYLIELPRQSCYLDRRMGLDRGHRMGGARGLVIALIPSTLDASLGAVKDLLRARASAGKLTSVEEFALP
jgi:hypothetical protein